MMISAIMRERESRHDRMSEEGGGGEDGDEGEEEKVINLV